MFNDKHTKEAEMMKYQHADDEHLQGLALGGAHGKLISYRATLFKWSW
jgi:hypothetical protein